MGVESLIDQAIVDQGLSLTPISIDKRIPLSAVETPSMPVGPRDPDDNAPKQLL